MIFWILIALLTGAAALSVLVPLSRPAKSHSGAQTSADEAVYREQLEAIDKELERGLIDAEAAEAARTETARRLLAAHDRSDPSGRAQGAGGGMAVARICAMAVLPVLALGLYGLLGSPDDPDQPLKARLEAPAEDQSVDILVARVERHLSENPEDGQGWAVVAPVYMTLGRPQASAQAYANALRILGPNPDWLTDMGEALTVANQGLVTAEAHQAFEEALKLAPGAVKPRFFLAVALGQDGDADGAIAAWEDLLKDADDTAAWTGVARQQLAALKGQTTPEQAEKAPNTPLAGPSRDQVEAAQDMPAEDRAAMISGMVAGLSGRLSSEGGSVEEWTQLIRAYMVLGQKEKAEEALSAAQTAYADSPADLSRIKDAASALGLSGS